MSSAFQSETVRRPDGHWVFIATEGGNRYELVHPDRFTPFTALQLHDMKKDAMSKFEGFDIRITVDNEPRHEVHEVIYEETQLAWKSEYRWRCACGAKGKSSSAADVQQEADTHLREAERGRSD